MYGPDSMPLPSLLPYFSFLPIHRCIKNVTVNERDKNSVSIQAQKMKNVGSSTNMM